MYCCNYIIAKLKQLVNGRNRYRFHSNTIWNGFFIVLLASVIMLDKHTRTIIPHSELLELLPEDDVNHKDNIKLIMKQIDRHTIISFDIFDTLLSRPYMKPRDLFKHLEQLENCSGFAKARIDAERQARKNRSEVTFDDIYSNMPASFQVLKQKELELEKQVATPNPQIQSLYNYAVKKKKHIIIISDMYLSKSFLTSLLYSKGYTTFKELYVSSDFGCTKYSGLLFNIVLQKERIKPSDMIHLGDNINSDKNQPAKYGITCVHYRTPLQQLLSVNSRVRLFFKQNEDNLGVSILLGLLAMRKATNNYWEDLGFFYGGPTILGFMKWLDSQLVRSNQGLDLDVLFVARDGYTLQKVFDLIKTVNYNTVYFYSPRELSIILTFDYLKHPDTFLRKYSSKNNFAQTSAPPSANSTLALEFIQAKKHLFQTLVSEERELYRMYLTKAGVRANNVALIDSITLQYSTQRALLSVFPEKVINAYYWVCAFNNQTEIHKLQFQKSLRLHSWNFMEFIMTAPTASAKTIDNGVVVFKKPTEPEKQRMEVYPDVSAGSLKFAHLYLEVFNNLDIFFTPDILVSWINTFTDYPSDLDKEQFANIKHAGDAGHAKYTPLFPGWYKS